MSRSMSDPPAAPARQAPQAFARDAGSAPLFPKLRRHAALEGRTRDQRTIACLDAAMQPNVREFLLVAILGVRTTRSSALGRCGYRERSAIFSRGFLERL